MSLMYAQMGLSAISTFGSYKVASIQADMQQRMQQYQNTMSALSAAQSRNTITSNEVSVRDASVRVAEQIQQQALTQEGSAAVAAGAAGVAGSSTAAVMRDLKGSAARANKSRTDQLQAQYRAFGQERRNVNLAQVYNKDVSVIPKPSSASMLLGLSTGLLDIWDSHQTPGDTIAARLSGTSGSTQGT